jgi:hypothetical protein
MAKTFTKFRSDLDEDILSLLEDDETELKVQAKTPGVATSLPTDEDELEDDDYAEWETVDAIPQTYVRGKNGTVTHSDEGVGQKGAEIPEAEMAEDLDEGHEDDYYRGLDPRSNPHTDRSAKGASIQRDKERARTKKKLDQDRLRAAAAAAKTTEEVERLDELTPDEADAMRLLIKNRQRIADAKKAKANPQPAKKTGGYVSQEAGITAREKAGTFQGMRVKKDEYTPDHGETLDELGDTAAGRKRLDRVATRADKRLQHIRDNPVRPTAIVAPSYRDRNAGHRYRQDRAYDDAEKTLDRAAARLHGDAYKNKKAPTKKRPTTSDEYTPDHGEALDDAYDPNPGMSNSEIMARDAETPAEKAARKKRSSDWSRDDLARQRKDIAAAKKKREGQKRVDDLRSTVSSEYVPDHEETFAEANEVIFTKKEQEAAAKRAKKKRDKRKANADDSDYDNPEKLGHKKGYWTDKEEDYRPSFKEFRDSFKEEPVYENVMDSLKKIVSRNQKSTLTFEDGTGTSVDPKQATNILQVYGALNKNNQPKMAAMMAKNGAGFSKALSFVSSQSSSSDFAHPGNLASTEI